MERYGLRRHQGLPQIDAPPSVAIIAVCVGNRSYRNVGKRRVVDVRCAVDQRGLQQCRAGMFIDLQAALSGHGRLHVANPAVLDLSPCQPENAPVPDELEVGHVNLRPGDACNACRGCSGRRSAV